MQRPVLRALFVEDSPTDYNLLLRLLRVAGYQVEATRVETEAGLRDALQASSWDVVISDHNLPEFSSTEALNIVKEMGVDAPFIIVSGAIGEDIAVEAMIAGADDYILKSRLPRLVPALKRSLAAAASRRKERAAAQRLRELSAHLEQVKENERTAIAREIHDDIGGLLTGLTFDLAWLQSHARGDEVLERLHNMQTLLGQARSSVQRILRELRPPMLELGVVAALEWQAQDFSRRHGIPCHFISNRETIAVSEAISAALFRICQEALTNIAKHAQATSVHIDIFADESSVTLEVTDDGVGLADDSQTKAGSYGLLGMRERAAALNGWVEINSAPGRGTSLMLSLPLHSEAEGGGAA